MQQWKESYSTRKQKCVRCLSRYLHDERKRFTPIKNVKILKTIFFNHDLLKNYTKAKWTFLANTVTKVQSNMGVRHF